MAHALLSPSSASRWLECTKAPRFEAQYPNKESDAAKEGTLAHSLGEAMIRLKAGKITQAEYDAQFKKISANEFFDGAMEEYCEDYASFVMQHYNEAMQHTSDAQLHLEQSLDLTRWVPEGFGTGDVGIVADGLLTGIDLKYGKGVPVSAHENKQLKIYALGFYQKFSFLFNIERVKMIIFQPRLDSVTEFEISAEDLLKWGDEYLAPRAALAFTGEGEYKPGDHCRFCKGKPVCKAFRDNQFELAKYDFKDPNELTDDEVAEVLQRVNELSQWAESVKEHALHVALANNKRWPGYKVVSGKGKRIITDSEQCAKVLTGKGFTDIYEPQKLISMTKLENLVGKAHFKSYVGHLIKKQSGAPTLVPESDKRPEYSKADSAILDFEND